MCWYARSPRTGVLFAEEKYTIKLRHSAKGDVALHSRQSNKTEAVTVVGPDGKVAQEKKQTTVDVDKYKQEVLEKTAGKLPNKVKRTYSEAKTTVDDQTEKRAYDGKEVLIEKKEDGYHFTVDGQELTGTEAGSLPQNFNAKKPSDDDMDKLMLPTDPVAVGVAWKIDGKKLIKLFGDDEKTIQSLDFDKAKGAGKLTKAYKTDGRQYGVLEFHFEVPLKALQGMYPCREGAKLVMTVVADGCIDGTAEADSATFKTKATGTADHVQDGQKTGVVIKFDIESVEKGTTTPVKK